MSNSVTYFRTQFMCMVVFCMFVVTFSGCRQPVPAGAVGRTWEPGGFDGELLRPGKHLCWGFCEMYLLETTDKAFEVPMSVLCADSLNFRFAINVMVSVNMDNIDAVKSAFENLKPVEPYLFTVEQLFTTYIRPVVDQEAQKVISRYMTPEVVIKRAQIIEEVRAAVMVATENSLLKVKRITVGSMDFPDVITRAQEAKAQRTVEIETARAEGEKQAAVAEARLTLARIEASNRILLAQSEADANRILASSVSPQLIQWKQLDVIKLAASGENNMFLVPYTDAVNGPGLNTSTWTDAQGILDAALLRRIQEASDAAVKAAHDSNQLDGGGTPVAPSGSSSSAPTEYTE